MNTLETVAHLGKQAGSRLKIVQNIDDVNQTIPFFHIDKSRQFKLYNFERHDNADRLPFFCNFLSTYVFKYLPSSINLEGYYNIELHDTYTDIKKDYNNCLVWSKRKSDHHVVLIPDLYQLADYGGKLDIKDTNTWDMKKDKVGFYGTTTGDRNPHMNTRIKTCFWAKQRDVCDFYITKIAQIPPQELYKCYPNFNDILHDPVDPKHMFKYKFLLDIPGNTCSWDRVPMIMNSNSLLFKMPCSEMCWYYPLLHDQEHYVHVTTDSIIPQYNYYMNNAKKAQHITQQANKFVNNFLKPQHAIVYLMSVLEQAAYTSGK